MQVTDVTELTVIPRETALTVLTDAEQFDAFYQKVRAEVTSHVPDLTTDRGRKAIAALAFKVTKTKTAIDEARKLLTEEWRANVKKADEAGKAIRDKLDKLRDEVRAPLTEWEAAEERRVSLVNAALDAIRAAGQISPEETSEDVAGRLAGLAKMDLPESEFRDHLSIAQSLLSQAIAALEAGVARLARAEQDARDLAEFREKKTARLAAEQAAQEKREAEEAEALAAKEAADRAAQAERDRVAREEKLAAEAEQRARDEAEKIARAAQARRDAEHAEQLAAAQKEAQRLRDEQEDRERKAAAQRAADEARAKDRKHKGEVMGAAKLALIEVLRPNFADGQDLEPIAVSIVRAIVAGEIPATAITF